MNECELTMSITALANCIAESIADDKHLALVSSVISTLGSTLGTIASQRVLCSSLTERAKEEASTEESVSEESAGTQPSNDIGDAVTDGSGTGIIAETPTRA